jgi:hypothetical protein
MSTPHPVEDRFKPRCVSCLRKFIPLLFFRQQTPLHFSATGGRLEVARHLVESKADVAARTRCFSPPPSHHLSLTICLAALAGLHAIGPSTTTKPTSLHTCAASALLNEASTSVTRPQNGSSKRLQSKSSRWQPARAPASRSRSNPTLLQSRVPEIKGLRGDFYNMVLESPASLPGGYPCLFSSPSFASSRCCCPPFPSPRRCHCLALSVNAAAFPFLVTPPPSLSLPR